jgi:hypothetical protein
MNDIDLPDAVEIDSSITESDIAAARDNVYYEAGLSWAEFENESQRLNDRSTLASLSRDQILTRFTIKRLARRAASQISNTLADHVAYVRG